jgi:serine phosphatase RsbU (regulator of sigma subunit)
MAKIQAKERKNHRCSQGSYQKEPGQSILFETDGVTEARNESDEVLCAWSPSPNISRITANIQSTKPYLSLSYLTSFVVIWARPGEA